MQTTIISSPIALSGARRLGSNHDQNRAHKSSPSAQSRRRGLGGGVLPAVRALHSGASSSEEKEEVHAPPAVMPRRRLINLAAATTALVVSFKAAGPAQADQFANDAAMAMLNRQGKVRFSDEEWKQNLKDEPYAYQVLRKEGTERPFSSPLNSEKRAGVFKCAGCGRQGVCTCSRLSPPNPSHPWPDMYFRGVPNFFSGIYHAHLAK